VNLELEELPRPFSHEIRVVKSCAIWYPNWNIKLNE
jgi:hypothetical protein